MNDLMKDETEDVLIKMTYAEPAWTIHTAARVYD
jgi:hypothetical protein